MNTFISNNIGAIGVTRPELLPKHPVWFTDTATCGIFELAKDMPPVKELLTITIEPAIRSSHIIGTPEAVSFEGLMLDGNNLILEISLKHNIKYISDTDEQNIHMAYFESTVKNIVVVLPTHHIQPSLDKYHEIPRLFEEGKLIVKPYIINVYGSVHDKKTIYVSAAMFIDVSVKRLD